MYLRQNRKKEFQQKSRRPVMTLADGWDWTLVLQPARHIQPNCGLQKLYSGMVQWAFLKLMHLPNERMRLQKRLLLFLRQLLLEAEIQFRQLRKSVLLIKSPTFQPAAVQAWNFFLAKNCLVSRYSLILSGEKYETKVYC